MPTKRLDFELGGGKNMGEVLSEIFMPEFFSFPFLSYTFCRCEILGITAKRNKPLPRHCLNA